VILDRALHVGGEIGGFTLGGTTPDFVEHERGVGIDEGPGRGVVGLKRACSAAMRSLDDLE
jgi:hypothetical protein